MPSPNWKDLYDQAVLETHPEKIPQRVQHACEAIHQYRMEKVCYSAPRSEEKLRAR
jgi:hypothetical protein